MATHPPLDAVRRPSVNAVIRLANAVGAKLDQWGLRAGDLNEEAILRAARRQTGLEDLGNERFRVPLGELLASYEEDRNLTFVGRLVARGMLIHLVANRMRIHRDLEQHPEILAGKISRPLFVVGLPRTGTTLLYGMLSQDPAARCLLFWETLCPSPPPDPATRDTDPRIRQAEKTVGQLHRAVPGLRAIHEMNPRGPDECLGLLLNTFTTPFFRGRVPRYRRWLFGIDEPELVAAYQEYRNQLLLLGWRCSAEHWVLKCPSHLFGLSALFKVFADGCVVQTHRDLAKAIPSLCSLTAALDGMSYRAVDLEEVAARDLEIVKQFVVRSMAARDEIGDGRVVDLKYEDLMRDPLGSVRRIYEHFGYAYTDALEQKISAYLAANPPHKHGVHRYELEDFHLDRRAIQAEFADYCDRFGISSE